jgi:16S rRNA C1402 (ribose-2'-O) methylase RsmI
VTAALSVSGFAASEFTFIGFLPFRGTDKTNKLAHIASIDHIVVFFEAPHRVVDTFEALMLLPHMSTRQCMYAREITKVYEEFQRGTIQQCKIQYFYSVVCIYIKLTIYLGYEALKTREGSLNQSIKGEFTVVIGPAEVASKKSSDVTLLLQQLKIGVVLITLLI